MNLNGARDGSGIRGILSVLTKIGFTLLMPTGYEKKPIILVGGYTMKAESVALPSLYGAGE